MKVDVIMRNIIGYNIQMFHCVGFEKNVPLIAVIMGTFTWEYYMIPLRQNGGVWERNLH